MRLLFILLFFIALGFRNEAQINFSFPNSEVADNSKDSLFVLRLNGEFEEAFIQKVILSRGLSFKCDSIVAKKVIDELCQDIFKLNQDLAFNPEEYDVFINDLIKDAYNAIAVSKICSNKKYYFQSKLLLSALYLCRNRKVFFRIKLDGQKEKFEFSDYPDFNEIDISEIKARITTYSDSVSVLTASTTLETKKNILKQLFKDKTSDSLNEKGISLSSLFSFAEGTFYINGLELTKEKRQAQDQKKIAFLFIIISTLAFVAVIVSIFNIRKNKKQNKLITEQKSILEHQKQEITDSINYSKRIQTAILPDLADIKQSLNDFFILYRPKDIVSGDFYYFNKVNNDVFIAAADCTGHGVPGAFMSLVGSKELKIANTISNSPAKILKHLNNGVKDTLRQNHIDGTKDGMDIALVRINGTTVTYSAANRPLWILKKDSGIIEEIKATKTAIAGFTEDNFEFDEHEINLAKGDTIYLFSDGYADQFGGDKQKKMTTKRFREFVLSIKDKAMTEQQLQLESFFNSWKGNTEQVDDLLVIGIRL